MATTKKKKKAKPRTDQPTTRAARLARKPAAEDTGSSVALWLGIGSGALAVATGVMAYLAASDASAYHDAVERKTTARELEDLGYTGGD